MEPRSIRHPCYSEDAHYYFARMHLAVAPACNIHCKYCNRKYDCVSESRPGVVSQVLKPSEAYRKVQETISTLPQLSVVGIAGPGDPLANPRQTFETFSLIKETWPELELCLSTNGLKLADHIEDLERLGIGHVTVTVNAVDPDIAAEIYDRVHWRGKTYRGKEAAEILLERQAAGIEELRKKDILCKINSVLIPGVNDSHLLKVAETVSAWGAFTHNIMPLIISPGSPYEREGRVGPSGSETLKIQEACSAVMPVMRHCRQCRADAIGFLGGDTASAGTQDTLAIRRTYPPEEREAIQLELEKQMLAKQEQRTLRSGACGGGSSKRQPGSVKVAVATRGNGKINLHFGHAKEFLVYEVEETGPRLLGVRKVQAYCNGTADCADPAGKGRILEETVAMLSDCDILLSSGIGENPSRLFREAGIAPIVKKGEIEKELMEAARFYRYLGTSAFVAKP
ncbi:nitrogenase cofactor biosynthesis protein NifB [Gorillibacterium timonense]|uniref:nitrogenase cofactor biosynthesis protein NifB n=1 Tax=Gorillibacterium timonense TaxID=1689269 RepID=UPI00071D8F64|nr:nitrogenase cofactor biosynthesis protein NifB [Gorillibacterium timonense]